MKKILISTLCLLGTFALNAQDITSNLIAHYKFNGNVNDATVNANHGTNSGALLTKNRNSDNDYAYDFNGIDNSIVIPNNPIISSVGQNVTITMWAYIREYDYAIDGKYYAVLVCKANNEDAADYRIAITENSFALINNGKMGVVNSSKLIPSLKWVHLACTISNTAAKVFINGEKVGETTLTGTYGLEKNSPLTLGRDDAGGIEYFGGKLDDIRIYSRALSENDITAVYNTIDFPTTNLMQDLIAFYPFDGDINDYSGNGNHGTSQGGNFEKDMQNNTSSAYDFNGTSDHISINNSTSLKSPSRFISMASWVKIRSFTRAIDNKDYSVLFCKSESTTNAQYRLAVTPYGISVINNGKLGTLEVGPDNTGSNWIHITAVIEDSLLTYYRNGELMGTMVLPLNFTFNKENKLFIGRDDPGGLEYYDGLLDDVRIYSRKLSATEVAQIYALKSATSLENIDETTTQIKVYPNPFKGEFHVELSNITNNSTLRIFDMQGKEIEIDIQPSNNGYIIQPKTNLTSGHYLLIVTDDNGRKSKIIISE